MVERSGVHRLFLDAELNDEVEAVDGDFTNFTTVTVRVIVEPVIADGLTVAKGDRPPSVESEEVTVPNLYVVNSDESQKNFEESMLQVKRTKYGDIENHLPIQPNADLGARAMCYGQVVDAGTFEPLTADDPVPAGYVGRAK